MDHADRPHQSDVRAGPAPEPLAIPDYAVARAMGTSYGAWAVVAIKVLGLYCIVQGMALVYLVPAYGWLALGRGGFSWIEVLLSVAQPLCYVVLGVVLVRSATWIATRVLGVDDPSADPAGGLPSPGRRIQAVAFSVLGVWLAVEGAIELVQVFVRANSAGRLTGDDVIEAAFADREMLAVAVARFILGIALFLGAKRLAHYWHRFRMRPVAPAGEPQ